MLIILLYNNNIWPRQSVYNIVWHSLFNRHYYLIWPECRKSLHSVHMTYKGVCNWTWSWHQKRPFRTIYDTPIRVYLRSCVQPSPPKLIYLRHCRHSQKFRLVIASCYISRTFITLYIYIHKYPRNILLWILCRWKSRYKLLINMYNTWIADAHGIILCVDREVRPVWLVEPEGSRNFSK